MFIQARALLLSLHARRLTGRFHPLKFFSAPPGLPPISRGRSKGKKSTVRTRSRPWGLGLLAAYATAPRNPAHSASLPSNFARISVCRGPKWWGQGSERGFPQPLRHDGGLEPGILAASLHSSGAVRLSRL